MKVTEPTFSRRDLCHECGRILDYTLEDIQMDATIFRDKYVLFPRYWIKCPCGEIIYIDPSWKPAIPHWVIKIVKQRVLDNK